MLKLNTDKGFRQRKTCSGGRKGSYGLRTTFTGVRKSVPFLWKDSTGRRKGSTFSRKIDSGERTIFTGCRKSFALLWKTYSGG